MKRDVPVAIGAQPNAVAAVLLEAAARVGAPVSLRGRDWTVPPTATGFRYDSHPGALYQGLTLVMPQTKLNQDGL